METEPDEGKAGCFTGGMSQAAAEFGSLDTVFDLQLKCYLPHRRRKESKDMQELKESLMRFSLKEFFSCCCSGQGGG